MNRRRLVIGLTVGLLVSWFVLETQESLEAEALYARQMLAIEDVQLVDVIGDRPSDEVGSALTDAIEEAVLPRVGHLASCLRTADGSRAPAVLEVQVGPDGMRRWALRCQAELSATEQACVDTAVEGVAWPSASLPSTVVVLLRTLADSDSDS